MLAKYANWRPPGCDIICVKGQESLKKHFISIQSKHYCTYPLYSDSWVELNSTDLAQTSIRGSNIYSRFVLPFNHPAPYY